MGAQEKRLRDAFVNLALQPRNLAKSLGALMPAASSQGMTVLAMDGQWIRVLQVEGPPAMRRITKLAACPVAGTTPDEARKAFEEMRRVEGLSPRDVLIANPTHLCTIRLFSLPSTDTKEIRDIVELQAEKHTPYAKEEILIDFKVTDRDRSGYSRVLLVIAHQDVVHRAVRVTELSGLTPDRVGCELEGLVNWFTLIAGGSRGQGPAVVMDVDHSTTTVLVMQRGQPQFHRSLAIGAQQLEQDPAQTGERLVSELQRSLDAMDAEGGGAKIQDVVLTGRVERLAELKSIMERSLDMPVRLVSPWGERGMPEPLQAAYERLPDVSFAGLVGLALAPSQLDLTPPTTKLHQAFEARAKSLVLLGCQCVGVLILLSLLIIGRVQRQQRDYDALRATYTQTAQEAQRVEEALQQIEFVRGRLRRRDQLLEAVEVMTQLSPPEIQWQSLTFTDGEGLVLKGMSKELPKIYEFVAGLDGTPLFNKVEAKRISKRKSGDADVTDFEITCPLVTSTKAPRT